MKLLFPVISISILFFSCGESPKPETVLVNQDTVKAKEVVDSTFLKGIRGVIDVPEILTLAVKDSGSSEKIPVKMAKAYAAIQKDMETLKLEIAGAPGLLFYNDNPKNLVFECVIPINKMPEQTPKKSQIVVLEATRAVVYNYYGPYDKMYKAYEELKPYITTNKLFQTSPAREFYMTNAEMESDTAKWLSRIFIPVK